MTLEYLIKNKDITELSNFKTKAKTSYYFEIHSRQDIDKIFEIYNFVKNNNIKILFVGGGTNILFAFNKFNGVIVKNCLKGWNYDEKTKILDSYSIENISDISKELLNKYRQNMWKRFIGLPGSIGGAIFGNAGCFGLETENNFLNAEILDINTGKITILSKKEMLFKYRSSIIKTTNNFFIIKARFDLSRIIEKYPSNVDNIFFREYKQPKGNTCGSFFKNPSKDLSAGKLIEESGLKGIKFGGAYFSKKHANFLMNDGNAKYEDIIEIINYTKKIIKEKYNIELIPEVRIITN